MIRIAMLVANTCNPDVRVIKEAETLAHDGQMVRVYCLRTAGLPEIEERNGVTYIRLAYDPWDLLRQSLYLPGLFVSRTSAASAKAGAPEARGKRAGPGRVQHSRWQRTLGRVLGKAHYFARYRFLEVLFAAKVAKWAPDIVHAHDLTMLPTAHAVARRSGARVIYDAHELETDRNPPLTPLRKAFVRALERRFARMCAAVITVSEPIADQLAKDYAIRRPFVVLNAPRHRSQKATLQGSPEAFPRHWDGTTCRYRSVRGAAEAWSELPVGVFVGKIMANRGVDIVLDALRLTRFVLVSVGPSDSGELESLRSKALAAGVGGRWVHVPPIDADDLIDFISDADFAIQSIVPITRSYDWALPNKLFEAAVAGLPMIATEAQEIASFVRRNGIGVIYKSDDPTSCAAAIDQLLARMSELRPDKTKLDSLRARYSWDAQRDVLRAAYAQATFETSG